MNKLEYIELYGYISNSQFKEAKKKAIQYNIDIKDWQKPQHEILSQHNINLMIELRLHLKHNCRSDFKDNFYRMDVITKHRGVCAVNYTGHILTYNGGKFSGDYKFCIHKNRKPIDTTNEKLYYINGSYPVYSTSSCLEEDIEKVKNTNSSWLKEDTIAIEIKPY